MPYLKSRDATVRGLAAWIMGSLGVEEVRPMLEKLAEDHGELQIYVDCRLIERQVRDLAEEALGRSI